MALIEIKNLHFQYPDAAEAACPPLDCLSLSINAGEFVVLGGPTGSGKTTLLRHIKHELMPVGRRTGDIRYKGLPFHDHRPELLAEKIGIVMQDPDNQLVTDRVLHELSFGLENLQFPVDRMRRRVAEVSGFFGITDWLDKKTDELSQGQKQILNMASVMALNPEILLMDEPTAQLDPVAASEFLQAVYRIHQEFGTTVILSEHRLEEVLPLGDRLILMDNGKIKYDGHPRKAIEEVWEQKDERFLDYLPAVSKLYLYCRDEALVQTGATGIAYEEKLPLTIKEAKKWMQRTDKWMQRMDSDGLPVVRPVVHFANKLSPHPSTSPVSAHSPFSSHSPVLLQARRIHDQYGKESRPVLKSLDLEVYQGDFLAILGANGSGKSTLLQVLAGIRPPLRGSVLYRGKDLNKKGRKVERIGYLAQNPILHFIHDTLQKDLHHSAGLAGAGNGDILRICSLLGIDHLLDQHPYDLSGGEKQKAALAGILLSRPDILLLDEPTKGLDPLSKRHWAEVVKGLHLEGVTIVMVTHDTEFAAKYANRCAMLFDGAVCSEGRPADFFSENFFYTTSMNRLLRDKYPHVLTYEDVVRE